MDFKKYFLLSQFLILVHGRDYIINNEKCKMADYKPFNEDTLVYYKKLEYVPCTNLTLLSYLERKNNAVYLRIRSEAIQEYTDDEDGFYCCYSYVTRKYPHFDSKVKYTPCKKISNELQEVPLEQSIVHIKCYNSTTLIYQNVHAAILPKILEKLKHSTNTNKVNVIMIAIDSMGNAHLRRTMPNTYNFVKENDFFEFKGYNKVGSNTFPNCMAILTGYDDGQAFTYCDPTDSDKLDNCPFIWKDYQKAGYVTAYVEDYSRISTFNFNKKGFKIPPTTFYWKPFIEASEKCGVVDVDDLPACTGPESTLQRIFHLIDDYSNKVPKQIPTFGLFWINNVAHGYTNTPTRWDDKMSEYLNGLKQNGVYNDSIVIFLSDHGLRMGDIVKTTAGYFEDRHPFLFISVPNWFKEKYPNEINNMKNNQDKLSSNFDLHMTLQDILVLTGFKPDVKYSEGCSKCQSLFSEIPAKRSCADAGINDIWCSCCGYMQKLDKNDVLLRNNLGIIFKKFGNFLIDEDLDLAFTHYGYVLTNPQISEVVNGYRILSVSITNNNNCTFLGLVKIKKDKKFGELIKVFRN